MELIIYTSQPFFVLGSLLLLKHFIADGPLQTAYMAYGKTQIGHPGGLLHAACHGLLTGIALLSWNMLGGDLSKEVMLQLIILDTAIHYCIDLTTGYFPRRLKWTSQFVDKETGTSKRLVTDPRFYWVFVGDQCLHFLTYLFIMSLVLSR